MTIGGVPVVGLGLAIQGGPTDLRQISRWAGSYVDKGETDGPSRMDFSSRLKIRCSGQVLKPVNGLGQVSIQPQTSTSMTARRKDKLGEVVAIDRAELYKTAYRQQYISNTIATGMSVGK